MSERTIAPSPDLRAPSPFAGQNGLQFRERLLLVAYLEAQAGPEEAPPPPRVKRRASANG